MGGQSERAREEISCLWEPLLGLAWNLARGNPQGGAQLVIFLLPGKLLQRQWVPVRVVQNAVNRLCLQRGTLRTGHFQVSDHQVDGGNFHCTEKQRIRSGWRGENNIFNLAMLLGNIEMMVIKKPTGQISLVQGRKNIELQILFHNTLAKKIQLKPQKWVMKAERPENKENITKYTTVPFIQKNVC